MEGISFRQKEASFTGGFLPKRERFLVILLVLFGLTGPASLTAQGSSASESADPLSANVANQAQVGNSDPVTAIDTASDSLLNVQGVLCDNDPPYWYEHFPFPKSVENSHFTRQIKFKLRDDVSGVDLNTFLLTVDGIEVRANSPGLKLEGDKKYYIVTYQIPSDHHFNWNDTIWVKLSVCDLWTTPNCMRDSIYFVIENDDLAPLITPEIPANQATHVPVNSRISFNLADAKSGIDFSTLTFSVNGIPLQPERLSGDAYQAGFVFNARNDSLFGFLDIIPVKITVKDSAGNPAYLDYSFEIAQELYSPHIEFIYPTQNSSSPILGTDSFVFQVTDLHSGVDFDKTEILLELNGARVEIAEPVVSPRAPNGFHYTIKPRIDFHHNDVGTLRVKAFDRAGNSHADETTFKVVQDTTPPSFSLQSPQEKIGVLPNHQIEILIADSVAGVDSKSIRLEINDLLVADYQLSPISAMPGSFILSLPSQSDWNESVRIQIHASDLANNADSATFTYEIIKDLQPPTISLLAPVTLIDVPLRHEVLLEISDEISGVNSDAIRIWVNEVSVTGFRIDGDTKRYRVSFNQQASWNDGVKVKVIVADHATNADSVVFVYEIIKDLQPPAISLLQPANQTDVPLQHEVLLEISDEISGVNSDAIQIWVDEVPFTDFQIIGDPKSYQVSFNHQAAWNDTVHLAVKAVDSAGNSFGPKPFAFAVQTDHVKPAIALINPIPDSEVNHARQQIKLEITDDSSGVDLSKIKIWVYDQIIEGWSISGDSLKYTCEFEYLAPWDTTVLIQVQVADFAQNIQSSSFNYKIPPPGPISIVLKSPQPMLEVSPQHIIEFVVTGSLAGIDSQKIQLQVNGDTVSDLKIFRSGQNEFTGSVSYFSSWNTIVHLDISAGDSAGQTQSIPFDYEIVKDKDGPEIKRQKPDTTVGIHPIVAMEYSFRDTVSGVDPNSVRLTIDGKNIPITLNRVDNETIRFTRTDTFQFNSTTNLIIEATDMAGNSTTLPDRYIFKVDSVPPVVTAISPTPGDTALSLNTPLIFTVQDTLAGVAIPSLLFQIKDETIPLSELHYTASPFDTLVTFTYHPKTPFALEDSVWINIGIKDKAGNMAIGKDTFYYFKTIEDFEKPLITLIEPDSNATEIARNHSIIFEVNDLLTGINPASLVLSVNGALVTPVVNPIDSKSLHARYAVNANFGYNDTARVEIYVEDNSVNKNNTKLTYKYYIIRDDTPPVFSELRPDLGAAEVPCRTAFHLKISDSLAGVDSSLFKFWLDGELIPHNRMLIKGDSANYTVDFGSGVPFVPGQVVSVKLFAVDLVGNPNSLEYHFTINPVEDKIAPLIVPLIPKENATNVARSTQLILSASDASGIDTASAVLVLSWDDQTRRFAAPDSISLDETGHENWFFYNFSADTLFEYNQGIITAAFSVLDLACDPNHSEKTYSFTIEKDETRPEIKLVKPEYLVGVSANTRFQFEIGDNETGIVTESIQLKLNQVVVQPVITVLKKNWVTINFNETEARLFEYGAQIPVEIRAVNGVGLDSVLAFTLITLDDATPPVIVWEHPAEGTRPPRNPELVFRLSDAQTGINLANSAMVIESTTGGPVEMIGIDPKGSSQYTVESVDGKFEYRVRFNPDSLRLFDYFQEVKVNISTENFSKLESAHSASLVQDFKVIDGDTLPPWVENLFPMPEQADVALSSDIQFDVLDSTGVENIHYSLFNLTLNTAVECTTIESREIPAAKYSGYHYTVKPKENFTCNDTIQIKIFATDVQQNAMKDTLTTRFFTQIDTTAPEIVVVSPEGKKADIRPQFNVKLRDISGVDTATVVFGWRHAEESMNRIIAKSCFQPAKFIAEQDTLIEYSFFIADSFQYDHFIDLFVEAADKEGNSVTHWWHIKTRKYDEEPPWIEYIDPKPEDELPFAQSDFRFRLGDALSYVVKEKICVDIYPDTLRQGGAQGARNWHFCYGDGGMSITEEENYMVVTITPPADDPFQFFMNETIRMDVYAIDAFANDTTFSSYFATLQDWVAPFLVSSAPADQSSNNPGDTGIKLELADTSSGIRLSTLRVYLINQSRFDSEPDSADWANAEELYPDSSKMKIILPENSVEVTARVQMEMPAGTMLFDVNRRIFLQILAEDAAVNKMDTVISFCTEEKFSDLFIKSAACQPTGKYTVGDTVKIVPLIANQYATVSDVFDISFELEGETGPQDTVWINPPFEVSAGKECLPGKLLLATAGKYNILITVDKLNSVMEQDEENNILRIPIEVDGGKLTVKSNPFTPNEDGINDDACFYCEQFQLENPCIKIFDLRGRFIKELGGSDFYEKKFRWDGRDNNGNQVMPGVFLYILQDQGQPLANGCVVVAR